MTYSEAEKFLGDKAVRSTGQRGTSLIRLNFLTIAVKYHDTFVVMIYSNNTYELNSGGWRTNTTKNRINEYCPQAGISQRKGVWYLSTGAEFKDGVFI